MGFSALTLKAAIESNILDHARAVALRSPQVDLHDEPDLLWLSSGIAHPYLNRVYRALFRTEGVDERVEETLFYFEPRGSPVSWHVGPSSTRILWIIHCCTSLRRVGTSSRFSWAGLPG